MSQINANRRNGDEDDDENGKDDHPSAPSKISVSKSDKTQAEFGVEGTNKIIPAPKPDGAPSEELGGAVKSRYVSKTPYTRG